MAAFLLSEKIARKRRLETGVKRPKPWLRYISASAASGRRLALDAMPVRNEDGDDLGIVDGLVVDAGSGRALYVVVDAGWFTVRRFLIPISRIDLDASRRALRAPLSKEQIGRFPGFDVGRFDPLPKSEVSRFGDPLNDVYEPGASHLPTEPHEAVLDSRSLATPHMTRLPKIALEPLITH
jgi:hypothetical protein